MQEIEIFRQIISSCDETLREVFLRRMEASLSIARSKLSRGEPVYTANREKEVLANITHGLSPELTMKAHSLWNSLLRLSRNRQYRLFLELDSNLKLRHEADIKNDLSASSCCCDAAIAPNVQQVLGCTPHISTGLDAALASVVAGEFDCCAVSIEGVYKTDWLFSLLSDKKLYLNKIIATDQNNCIAIISKYLSKSDKAQIISAVFNMSSESGSLAGILSVLADNKQNMEFLHMEKCDEADNLHQFLLFVDFDGNLSSIDTRAAIYQLESELPYFRIVGARD